MALTAAQRRARDKAEKILLEQQRGSSLFANNQSFPGDFGDGGAVGENITPAPRAELSDLEKESADATAAIESAMAAGDAAAKAGDLALSEGDLAAVAAGLPPSGVNLSNSDRAKKKSAYDILFDELNPLGLGALVEAVLKPLIEDPGVSEEQFTSSLRASDQYKKRFAANEERIAKGLRPLSEASYIALEDKYQDVMRRYGLPETYYSKGEFGVQKGFESLIASDVSNVELEDRLMVAQDRVLKSNPEVMTALKQFYPDIKNGDILAYTLDPKNAIKEIQRKVTAAEIGGAALTQTGLTTSLARAEQLQRYGVDKESATAGFSTIGAGLQRGSQLASIYGEDPYTQETAETEVFRLSGQQEARKQRQKITGLEKATFGGQTGLTSGALARDRAGGY